MVILMESESHGCPAKGLFRFPTAATFSFHSLYLQAPLLVTLRPCRIPTIRRKSPRFIESINCVLGFSLTEALHLILAHESHELPAHRQVHGSVQVESISYIPLVSVLRMSMKVRGRLLWEELQLFLKQSFKHSYYKSPYVSLTAAIISSSFIVH